MLKGWEHMDWEYFRKDDGFTENIIYFHDEWADVCSRIEKGVIGIEIINLRIVLSDIINEYELNQLQNANNRRIYVKLIEKALSENSSHLKKHMEELHILKEQIKENRKEQVYVITKEILNVGFSESSAMELFDELLSLLRAKETDKTHRQKIKKLCSTIIIELITSGQSVKDIKDYVSTSFGRYIALKERTIPLYDDLPEKAGDIKEYIDKLTVDDRLKSLRKKLLLIEKNYKFIFPIWGLTILPCLKSSNNEIELFDGSLYDPELQREFTGKSAPDESFCFEVTERDTSENKGEAVKSRCNAKIYVTAFSPNAALSLAQSKLFRILNLVNSEYANEYHEFFTDMQYIGQDLMNGHISFGWTGGYQYWRGRQDKLHHFQLDDYEQSNAYKVTDVLKDLEKRNMVYELKTLERVIALLSKSKSVSNEDRLVNYWICLESLANIAKSETESKYEFISKAIPNIYYQWAKYEPLHRLYRLTAAYSIGSSEKDETVNIPDEFIKDTHVDSAFSIRGGISLINFYKRMKELLDYTTKPIFLDEIEEAISFYGNNSTASKEMEKKKGDVELTIAYIYKCRNQIVHNGYVDQNLIPYLVEYARGYAESLMNTVIRAYSAKKGYSLREYFLQQEYYARLLEKKLGGKAPVELVDDEKPK